MLYPTIPIEGDSIQVLVVYRLFALSISVRSSLPGILIFGWVPFQPCSYPCIGDGFEIYIYNIYLCTDDPYALFRVPRGLFHLCSSTPICLSMFSLRVGGFLLFLLLIHFTNIQHQNSRAYQTLALPPCGTPRLGNSKDAWSAMSDLLIVERPMRCGQILWVCVRFCIYMDLFMHPSINLCTCVCICLIFF